jgi:hypothetical protein
MACGKKEDVQVLVKGSQLVIENRTGDDIHFQLTGAEPVAFIALATPANRLDKGRQRSLRIAPSERGSKLVLHWWFAGEKIDGVAVADRVRRIPFSIDPLQEPIPIDEQYVLACLDVWQMRMQARRAQSDRFNLGASQDTPHKAERQCMTEAEAKCMGQDKSECRNSMQGFANARQIMQESAKRP